MENLPVLVRKERQNLPAKFSIPFFYKARSRKLLEKVTLISGKYWERVIHAISNLWAKTSNRQCLFVMVVEQDNEGRDVRQQIQASLG